MLFFLTASTNKTRLPPYAVRAVAVARLCNTAKGAPKRPVIVTTLCDSGQRGISKLYSDDFLTRAGLLPWKDEEMRRVVLTTVDFVS